MQRLFCGNNVFPLRMTLWELQSGVFCVVLNKSGGNYQLQFCRKEMKVLKHLEDVFL